jgi:hypothetical protein
MLEHLDSFDQMPAAWNVRDLGRIAGHLAAALTPDLNFIDPTPGADAVTAICAAPAVRSARAAVQELQGLAPSSSNP